MEDNKQSSERFQKREKEMEVKKIKWPPLFCCWCGKMLETFS